MLERKHGEQEFHNRRQAERAALNVATFERRYSNFKFYSVTARSLAAASEWIRVHSGTGRFLDYCCGEGDWAREAGNFGAVAVGVDIALESVLAAKESASNGPEEPPKYAVMDGECLAFPDNSFDSAICAGVLHHLDIRMAYAELARVLKPGGAVLCCEPLAYNPAIQLYRRLTPHLRTGWEAEHIISLREIRYAGELFERVTVRYYHLMTLLAVPFRRAPGFGKLLAILGWIDSWLLRIPGLQLMAWQVLFELSEPRKVSRP